jgi:hypothetical protein
MNSHFNSFQFATSQSHKQAKVPHAILSESPSEAWSERTERGVRPVRLLEMIVWVSSATVLRRRDWTVLFGTERASAQWILQGDIKSCVYKTSHAWLLAHVPMDRVILQEWLKSGYMEKHVLHESHLLCELFRFEGFDEGAN